MTDHPLPPEDLNSRKLKIEVLATGTTLFRIHASAYSPIFFGQSLPHRFDAPKQYGILYVGMTDSVAFLEAIRGRVREGWLDRQSLSGQSMSKIVVNSPLSLIRASGPALEQMGANSGLFSTKHRSITQAWSLAFWQHPQQAHGIMYPSCHDNEQFCLALYSDRSQEKISVQSTVELLSDKYRDRLDEITSTYGYRVSDM
jgi:RES domain